MPKVKKMLRLSDFEWASAAKYIVYIAQITSLHEINSNHVVSFPLGRIGPDKLLKQKRSVLGLLKDNRRKLEVFVGEHDVQLCEREMAVIRSMYSQFSANCETVMAHIDICATVIAEIEVGILQSQGGGEDDQLF